MGANFAMMVRVRGNVSAEQMRVALNQIRVRHLPLIPGFTLEKPDDDVIFPLFVRNNCSDTDWVEVAQSEQRNEFPPSPGPFARFTLFQRAEGFDIVATFHHWYCDGMSGMFVLRDLLQALGQPNVALIPIAHPPSTDKFMPDLLVAYPGLRRKVAVTVFLLRLRVLFEKIKMRLSPRKPAALHQPQETPIADLPLEEHFVILPAQLTLEQTAALVARCKKEQVSVHAAICVAWLRALAGEPTHVKRFDTVSSPVNIRQRLSPPIDDTSGEFLGNVETHIDCKPEKDFWQLAREFKQNFKHDTRDEALFFRPAMFATAPAHLTPDDFEILAPILFFGPVKYDFSITNLGRLPIAERIGSLQVDAFYGPLVNSSPYERTVGVSTLAGKMSLSFLFRKSTMSPARGQALMDRAIALLAGL